MGEAFSTSQSTSASTFTPSKTIAPMQTPLHASARRQLRGSTVRCSARIALVLLGLSFIASFGAASAAVAQDSTERTHPKELQNTTWKSGDEAVGTITLSLAADGRALWTTVKFRRTVTGPVLDVEGIRHMLGMWWVQDGNVLMFEEVGAEPGRIPFGAGTEARLEGRTLTWEMLTWTRTDFIEVPKSGTRDWEERFSRDQAPMFDSHPSPLQNTAWRTGSKEYGVLTVIFAADGSARMTLVKPTKTLTGPELDPKSRSEQVGIWWVQDAVVLCFRATGDGMTEKLPATCGEALITGKTLSWQNLEWKKRKF